MQRETLCYCGHTVKHDFPERIDLSKEPDAIEEILDGTFLQISCDACGQILKPDFPLLLEHVPSPTGSLSVEYFPEPDRVRVMAGKVSSQADRVVIGYPELREKIFIFKSLLDDRVVEILKFLLLEKAGTEASLTILLEECTDEQLSFYIYGLKEQEVGLTNLSMEIYQKVLARLDEGMQNEAYVQITEPPYVSINKISLEEGEEQ